jgi:hypothetical protein
VIIKDLTSKLNINLLQEDASMNKYVVSVCCMLVLLLGAVGVSNASTVVFSDNFNSENGGNGALDYNNFSNWIITGGTVDLIGNGYFDFMSGQGYGLYVDLDGSTGQAGTMTSKKTLSAGSYSLTFSLAGSHVFNNDADHDSPNIVEVSAGGSTPIDTVTLLENDPFSVHTISFYLNYASPVSISFHNLGGDNVGALLDNVTLSEVPIPSALLLLGPGLIGLVGIRRRMVS